MTAADLARRKGLEEETVRFLRSWSLEAERKMGRMLIETDRAKGTAGQFRGKDSSGNPVMASPETKAPTLEDLGLTLKESARAQRLAGMGSSRRRSRIRNSRSEEE